MKYDKNYEYLFGDDNSTDGTSSKIDDLVLDLKEKK